MIEAHARNTAQRIAPVKVRASKPGKYDLYPVFPVNPGSIGVGFTAIAEQMLALGGPVVRIDGYLGVAWEIMREQLDEVFRAQGIQTVWLSMAAVMKSASDVEAMIAPFLGGDDPVFGTRFTGKLRDFFDDQKLAALATQHCAELPARGLTLIYGCGAGLVDVEGTLFYVDLPKNELQFRSRAGAVCNLGATQPSPPKPQYKRFYFVDWVALNRHKADVLAQVDAFVDEQRPQSPTVVLGAVMRQALEQMACNCFRVRPWFEPGPWGGQWAKRHIGDLPQEVPNYAWSFELIVPENGLTIGDGEHCLEVSFDWLMFQGHRAVLGDSADWFQYEFPIRFDFLDTFDGGNLSLQCHPRPDYIRRHFGETFTQDETYYILDCQADADVFLGFQEGIEPDEFHADLQRSVREGMQLDVKRFVNNLPAHKHALYLIPNGTVHCSGAGNLVLEISATPYIFTFKMYDWLRVDLDGQPRPLNIERAFQNLAFERQGVKAVQELVSHPRIIDEGDDWQLVHLPTHTEHFYDVHRVEFGTMVQAATEGSAHIMMLVEGQSVVLETARGMRQRFNYAETFVVPAAADTYQLINEGPDQAAVVRAFMKPPAEWPTWMRRNGES